MFVRIPLARKAERLRKLSGSRKMGASAVLRIGHKVVSGAGPGAMIRRLPMILAVGLLLVA